MFLATEVEGVVPLETVGAVRSAIAHGEIDRRAFRRELLGVDPRDRDAWLDEVLGFGIAEDGPELPRGCVPYLPCRVDALVRLVDAVSFGPSDVFVDIGSGPGRAAALVHLLTGAPAIGIEIQHALAQMSRELVVRFPSLRVTTIEGDASACTCLVTAGTVFFLYCPFSGPRLERLLDELEAIAAIRSLVIATVDLPLPDRSWLVRDARSDGDLEIYRTNSA